MQHIIIFNKKNNLKNTLSRWVLVLLKSSFLLVNFRDQVTVFHCVQFSFLLPRDWPFAPGFWVGNTARVDQPCRSYDAQLQGFCVLCWRRSFILSLVNQSSKGTRGIIWWGMSRQADSLLWCGGGCYESLTFWDLHYFHKDNEDLIMQLKKQR